MNVLQELLGPVPVSEFLQRAFSRAPLAMPDRAGRYTTHFTEADFACMVEHPCSTLRVVRNGHLVQSFKQAHMTEQEHLQKVRTWVAAGQGRT